MEKYDYVSEVADSVYDYLAENYSKDELLEKIGDRDFEITLAEEVMDCDSVTGLPSGSFFCNGWAAEEALCHNFDLMMDALEETGMEIGRNFSAESADVEVRIHVLPEAVHKALQMALSDIEDGTWKD